MDDKESNERAHESVGLSRLTLLSPALESEGGEDGEDGQKDDPS